jgi:hypothetical protein
MPKPGKAPLMALRERLAKAFSTPPAPQNLVPIQPTQIVPDDLYDSMKRGDGRAVETVSRALGRDSIPRGEEGLRQLIEEVSPSRRGFLKGMGSSAAHLIMPSPLKFLRETEDALRPRLTAELTPYELMEYSKKYVDKPLNPANWKQHQINNIFDALGIEDTQLTGRDALLAGTNDTDLFEPILRDMDLQPTQQNIDSINALSGAIDSFHPDAIDADFDDIKYNAQSLASGEYDDTDSVLERLASDFGVYGGNKFPHDEPSGPEFQRKAQEHAMESSKRAIKFEDDLNTFLDSLHHHEVEGSPVRLDSNGTGTYTSVRRELDASVEDEMMSRGYDFEAISETSNDIMEWFKEKDGPELLKVVDDYLKNKGFMKIMDGDVVDALTTFRADPTPENKQKAITSVQTYASGADGSDPDYPDGDDDIDD